MLMEIDENTIKLEDIEAVEIPEAEVVSESHGESMFPIHKPDRRDKAELVHLRNGGKLLQQPLWSGNAKGPSLQRLCRA